MILVVDLKNVKKVDILAALCILVLIGQWNSTLTCLNNPMEVRKFIRAGGDAFIRHYYTFKDVGVDSFHHNPHGKGLYDLVREFAADLLEELPRTGRSLTLDMPKGEFLLRVEHIWRNNWILRKKSCIFSWKKNLSF